MDSEYYSNLLQSVKSRKGIKYIGEGNTRIVYLSKCKRFVLKVPRDDYGLNDNTGEHREYRKGIGPFKREQLARCRLSRSGILIMEYVRPVTENKSLLPTWTDFVDCQQVGINRSGALGIKALKIYKAIEKENNKLHRVFGNVLAEVLLNCETD